MATTARLDLSGWRNDDVWEYPLRVRGMDLSGVDLDMQFRLREDAPGAPLIALAKVVNANAEGLRVARVYLDRGVTVSDLRIRLNKSTRQGLPYQGEIGDPLVLSYALRFAGRTRLVGDMIVLAHAYGSDAAPANRPPSWRPNPTGLPDEGATLTIAGEDVTEVRIDGAGILERAEAAAVRAEAASYNAGYGTSVATFADLAKIPADKLVEGMPIYVRDVGIEYRLSPDLVTWYDSAEPLRDSIRTLLYDWRPGISVLGTNGVQLRLATAIDLSDMRRRTTAQVEASRERAKAEIRDPVPDWQSGAALIGTNGRMLRVATAKDMALAAAKVGRDIAAADAAAMESVREVSGDWQAGIGIVGGNGKMLRLITGADLAQSENRNGARTKGIVLPLLDRAGRRHVVAAIGDSRVDAVTLDGLPGATQRRYSAASGLNWANALLGGRLTVLPDYGVSGERTDEIMARIDAAVATGAGTLYIMAGVNDIAQAYPTAGSSGITAFQNIRTMAEKGLAAGMIVVIELEVGANSLDGAKLGQVEELNAQLVDWAEGIGGVYLNDVRGEMMEAAGAGTVFRAGLSYDGTHEAPRGSFVHGRVLAKLLGDLVPPRPVAARTAVQLPSTGRRQLLVNPLFVNATGGTRSGAVTGPVPASWLARTSGGASVTLSAQPDPQGVGNTIILDITFAAAGDEVYLSQDVALDKWDGGEIVQPALVAELLDPTVAVGLISVVGSNVVRRGEPSEASVSFADGDGLILDAPGIHQPALLTLRGRPVTLLARDRTSWLAMSARIRGCAAGTARVALHSLALYRRVTSY